MTEPASLKSKASVQAKKRDEGGIWETVKVVVQALVIALVVRTFLFQPFNIPSGSMIPTLLIGDYLFVSKYSYGYSRYSFPFGPNLFSGRLLGSAPKRGDVAVFKLPRDNDTDYIKRVIGLPGDRVQMKLGRLYINGTIVPRDPLPDYTMRRLDGSMGPVKTYRETLPGGIQHTIVELEGDTNYWDNTDEFVVPPSHYFMMGDDRDNSADSRVPATQGGVGYVPLENFVGRAEINFFSVEDGESAARILEVAVDDSLEPFVPADPLIRERPLAAPQDLEIRIGHRFADPTLLTRALTHVSAVVGGARTDSNQRLEFLGDRVLGLAVCDLLYRTFPDAPEGELSRRLAGLVRRETCADVALEWGLGDHVRLGDGEAQSGGHEKVAILADLCEAVIGAVFLDAGFPAAATLVANAWQTRIASPPRPLRDPKTTLQEWAQARRLPTPMYTETSRSGPPHAPVFTVSVAIDGLAPLSANGPSKRFAQQTAAEALMRREKIGEGTDR